MRLRLLAATLLALSLAACQPFVLVPPGKGHELRNVVEVDVGRPWNRMNPQAPGAEQGPVEVWTIDGGDLDSLILFLGVDSGSPLFVRSSERLKGDPLPPFRHTMGPNEVMELFEATFARVFQSPLVDAGALAPATVAGQPGFRFEYTFTGKDSVDRKGVAAGTIRAERLYLLTFTGTRIYHFGAYRAEAEAIFASARFIGRR
jgi:hypothetical protein